MIKPDFNKYSDRLVPTIIQDSTTGKVLMLGYMNEESLSQTVIGGKVVFYSRQRQKLWTKGGTSGNYLFVKDILLDCDKDCLLIKVNPVGPVCHSGTDTCFDEENKNNDFLITLEKIIQQRKLRPDLESYVSSLFAKGINKIAQKVGEEAVELIIESKDDNIELLKNEAADLLFHYLVLLQAKGIELNDIVEVLKSRNIKSAKSEERERE